jgi:hypothetical protein
MDYYQGAIDEYLLARKRSIFIQHEYTVDISGLKFPPKGSSWIIDVLAVDFEKSTAMLCEITYSKTLYALVKRLSNWNSNWDTSEAQGSRTPRRSAWANLRSLDREALALSPQGGMAR